MNKVILGGVMVAVVCGGGGFYGGVAYQKKQIPAIPDRGAFTAMRDGALPQGAAPQGPGSGASRSFGGGVTGEVQSIDGTSMTVKSPNGSVQTVYLGENTSYTKDQTVSQTDVTVGSNVFVTGTSNNDNSVTATLVRVGSAQ